MTVREVGVEEELLLLDPGAGEARQASPAVLARAAGEESLDLELLRHQVETASAPSASLGRVGEGLRGARVAALEAAQAAGLDLVACGVVPRGTGAATPSPDDRYRDIVARYGSVARAAGTCGMHVHVDVDSPEEGVAIIDRITPWLPVLLAVSANSPFADDADTGYASWRAQVWSRWPTAGPNEPFGSLQSYEALSRDMVGSGAARDEKMLYFDARLGVGRPTVELRVTDVCTDVEDALLVAALARGLVERAARDHSADAPPPTWRVALLRAAQWRASRDGVTDLLVHPGEGTLRPARQVLGAVRDELAPVLREAGDLERVDAGIDRVLAQGGATRQRAAFERTGDVRGVVADLVARTRDSASG